MVHVGPEHVSENWQIASVIKHCICFFRELYISPLSSISFSLTSLQVIRGARSVKVLPDIRLICSQSSAGR